MTRTRSHELGIFSGRPDSDDDPLDLPIDDAATFDVSHRQRALQTRIAMMRTYEAIFGQNGSLGKESRRQKYIHVRPRRWS